MLPFHFVHLDMIVGMHFVFEFVVQLCVCCSCRYQDTPMGVLAGVGAFAGCFFWAVVSSRTAVGLVVLAVAFAVLFMVVASFMVKELQNKTRNYRFTPRKLKIKSRRIKAPLRKGKHQAIKLHGNNDNEDCDKKEFG